MKSRPNRAQRSDPQRSGPKDLPQWASYVCAAGFSTLTFWVRFELVSVIHRPILILFALPVVLSAWIGGFGPAFLATVLCALGIAISLPPSGTLWIADPLDRLQWIIFVIVGLLIAILMEYLRRSMIRRQEMEKLAVENKTREKAMAVLKESEERFRSTFELAAIGIAHVSLDGRWLRVNQQLCQITGYSSAELLSKTFVDITHPDDAVRDRQLLERFWTENLSTARFEKRYLKKDGSTVWVNLTTTLARKPDGMPDYFITAIQDIQESKRMQTELERSAALLEESQTVAGIGGWDFNVLTQSLYWTSEAYRIHETSPSEYIPSVATAIRFYAPNSIPLISAALKAAIDEGKPYQLELELITAKSRRIWVQVTSKVIREEGRTTRVYGSIQDITERRFADRQLQTSQAKYSTMFDLAPFATALLKWPSGTLVEVNEAWCRLLGYSREESIGKSSLELGMYVSLADRDRVYEAIGESGGIRNYEAILKTKFGEKRIASISTKRIELEGQVYALGTIVDMTETRRAEEAMRLSEEKFIKAFETNPSAISITSLDDGVIHEVNETWQKMFGFRREEVIGRSTLDIGIWVEPGIRAGMREELRQSGSIQQRELALKRKNGEEFVSLASGAALDVGGKTLVLSTWLDISDRKRNEWELRASEERFRTFAEAMPHIAFIADRSGRFTYFNRRFLDYVGENEPKIDVGELSAGLVHPDDLKKSIDAWVESLKSGKLYQIEHRLRRSDGEYRWHLSRAVAIHDKSGAIRQWLGTATDIHEQKEISARLGAAVKARDEFLSIASHELKTPLSSLKIQAQHLRKNIDRGAPDAFAPESVTRLVDQTNRQVARLVRLVDDMLDVSRIESGRFVIQSECCQICDLVKEVLERLAPQLEAAGCKPEFECKEPVTAHCDPFRMEQVVTNLLTNAMKYGEGRPVTVRVEKVGGDWFRLSVQDRGIGISQENQSRIFDRFERAISSMHVSGLGLGLYISREIVRLHGGRIWVESEEGKGSTFYAQIPVSPPDSGVVTEH